MALFSKSKSSSQVTETVTNQNAGFSEIGGPVVSVQSTGGAVNVLDAGAIGRSFDFAGEALRESLRQVELAGTRAAAQTTEAVRAVVESARTETENIMREGMKWAVIALIAWAGFAALRRARA